MHTSSSSCDPQASCHTHTLPYPWLLPLVVRFDLIANFHSSCHTGTTCITCKFLLLQGHCCFTLRSFARCTCSTGRRLWQAMGSLHSLLIIKPNRANSAEFHEIFISLRSRQCQSHCCCCGCCCCWQLVQVRELAMCNHRLICCPYAYQ